MTMLDHLADGTLFTTPISTDSTSNDALYCELSQAIVRIGHLRRLLDEAYGIIDILQGQIQLSRREREVLRLSAQGFSIKDIGTELKLSTKTVEFYRTKLMKKLRVHDVVRLTHCAIRLGI